MSVTPDLDAARRGLASGDEEERRRALAGIPEEQTAGALPLIVEALGDASWRVRKDAVARVARWPDVAAALAQLVSAVTSANESNVGLRNAAVEALAAIGSPSVEPLGTALDAGGEHRKFLIDALGAIGDRAAAPALIRHLDDVDENVRAAAAEALGAIGGDEAVAALERRLQGGADLLGRLAALESLNRLEARVEVGLLAGLVGEPILRRAALEALGWSGDLEALPYLLDGLADRSRGCREAAQAAVAALHGGVDVDGRARIEASVRAARTPVVQGLGEALAAVEPRSRRAAATLLGWGRWPEALPALVEVLRDEATQEAAAGAIAAYGPTAVAPLCELARDAPRELRGEIFALFPSLGAAAADARVAALLCRALEDDDPDAAAGAARALGEVGGKEALGALFHALGRDDDPQVAQAAGQALARLGLRYYDEVRMLIAARGLEGDQGVHLCRVLGAIGRSADRPLLLTALRSTDPPLRRAAAEAMAALGPAQEAREALGYALADEDARVRAAAADALGALGDPAAAAPLTSACADDEELVRAAAARALGLLGEAGAAPVLRELARRGEGAACVHAIEALGRLRPAQPTQLLVDDEALFVDSLRKPDPEVVKAAVRALAGRDALAALEAMIGALDHARWDVRRLTAQLLAARVVAAPADDPGATRAAAALRARAAVETDPLVREALGPGLEVE